MARSFSNVKLFLVAHKLSVPASRRGCAGAAQAAGASSNVRGGGGAQSSVVSKKGGEACDNTKSWVPDPVTGYYRPESKANEIDAAELRQLLLKHKK